MKFETPGDRIAGTITAVRTHRFDDGSVAPQILLTTDDGDERTLTAGQVRLKAALAAERPEAGDHLIVTFVKSEKRTGGKTLKHFEVTVVRNGGTSSPTAGPDHDTSGAPPEGIDPTAWNALSFEQKQTLLAAMGEKPPF
ncbi:MAG TPA: hypothetical protein VFC00_29025 [Micromonosporaceae bacterium]|nr:hypothetical protein [Micromonosporaceae bacterium]